MTINMFQQQTDEGSLLDVVFFLLSICMKITVVRGYVDD